MRPLKITETISTREGNSLNRYLAEIGKYKILTPEQEVYLVNQIKSHWSKD